VGKSGFAKFSQLKVGDKLSADAGFTCLREGEIGTVRGKPGHFYVLCAGPEDEAGRDYGRCRHYLDGQSSFDSRNPEAYGDEEVVVGLYKVGEML
jgi:hypothetical protein